MLAISFILFIGMAIVWAVAPAAEPKPEIAS
jgi:hypothetical protein